MNNETEGSTDDGPITTGSFSCFDVDNASMYTFESVSAGPFDVVVSQIDCENGTDPLFGNEIEVLVFQAPNPCAPATYTELACQSGTSFIDIDNLMAADSAETFYILVDGSLISPPNIAAASCDYTIQIAGVAVEPDPPFSATPIYNVPFGTEVVLNASGANEYLWTDEFGAFVDTLANPTITPLDTMVYTVTGQVGSCTLEAQVLVNVIFDIFPYNAFTPNGDMIHDYWEILQSDLYPTMDVRVYSRWGQQVYRSTGYGEGSQRWDGRKNGTPLPAGTYYYVIELNREGFDAPAITGSVAIIY
jgi:gliding motility-associated-like protein